jgi:hypothetical protein
MTAEQGKVAKGEERAVGVDKTVEREDGLEESRDLTMEKLVSLGGSWEEGVLLAKKRSHTTEEYHMEARHA